MIINGTFIRIFDIHVVVHAANMLFQVVYFPKNVKPLCNIT